MKSWDIGENCFKTWEFWAGSLVLWWEKFGEGIGDMNFFYQWENFWTGIQTKKKISDYARCEIDRSFLENSFQNKHALGFDTSNLSVYKGSHEKEN